MNKNYYIYGIHTCIAELESSTKFIKEIYISRKTKNKLVKKIEELAFNKKIRVSHVDKDQLTIMCQSSNHQGVAIKSSNLSVSSPFDMDKFLQISSKPMILIIDSVQDPHNFGACIRTANAAGVSLIVKRKTNSVGLTPTVQKVASGGCKNITIFESNNIIQVMKTLKKSNIPIVGTADSSTENIYSKRKFPDGFALVVGSEDEGIRKSVMEYCDYVVKIPIYGSVDCLNLSVATGVALYQLREHLKNTSD